MTIHKITGVRYGTDTSAELVLFVDGIKVSLAKSLEVIDHSPDGFNAGYLGSGPAQSALAILLHVTKNEKISQWFHQGFKQEFLSDPAYQKGGFEFEVDIHKWVDQKMKEYFHPINVKILEDSGIPFNLNDIESVAMFREDGKPMVDFYPSTGRWRIVGQGGTPGIMMPTRDMTQFRKGARSFLNWYKQK